MTKVGAIRNLICGLSKYNDKLDVEGFSKIILTSNDTESINAYIDPYLIHEARRGL